MLQVYQLTMSCHPLAAITNQVACMLTCQPQSPAYALVTRVVEQMCALMSAAGMLGIFLALANSPDFMF